MSQQTDRLGNILETVMSNLGMRGKYHGWQIVKHWPTIVGADVARVSRAVRFTEGTLIVNVTSDAWRQELEMQREHILGKIRSRPGGRAVRKIILKAGSIMETENDHDHHE